MPLVTFCKYIKCPHLGETTLIWKNGKYLPDSKTICGKTRKVPEEMKPGECKKKVGEVKG